MKKQTIPLLAPLMLWCGAAFGQMTTCGDSVRVLERAVYSKILQNEALADTLKARTAQVYRLREEMRTVLPLREREAEKRGWKRGGRDAWEFGGCVAGGAVAGSLFGPPGGIVGAGVGAAVGGVRALVRKWKRR